MTDLGRFAVLHMWQEEACDDETCPPRGRRMVQASSLQITSSHSFQASRGHRDGLR